MRMVHLEAGEERCDAGLCLVGDDPPHGHGGRGEADPPAARQCSSSSPIQLDENSQLRLSM